MKACSEGNQNTEWMFCHVLRLNAQNMTKPLLGFQFLSYLFITQCACSLGLCFRKKDF